MVMRVVESIMEGHEGLWLQPYDSKHPYCGLALVEVPDNINIDNYRVIYIHWAFRDGEEVKKAYYLHPNGDKSIAITDRDIRLKVTEYL